MRDRLIELLKKTVYRYQYQDPAEAVADYLLANGVIVPPVKVGDTVYIIASLTNRIIECNVIGVWVCEGNCSVITDYGVIFTPSIDKTVFLTREEAERALKGDKDINVLCKTEKGGE